MPAARFDLASCPTRAVLDLERELEVSATLAQVLVRRGLADPLAAREFLAGREEHDPGDFVGIELALQTIMRHVRDGSQITIHGDYDVDGVCSTALLVRTLRRLRATVDWYLPDRAGDGYGLNPRTVSRLAARGTRLLLTADCAISAVDEVAQARAAGVDVVVTDHHAPRADGRLPDAPIVHPAVCGYPCASLCATAVAYKLALALTRAAGGDERTVHEDLDLVALATVADVVPLLGENRTLARRGLLALATTAKPGLRALMAVARVDPSRLDERAIGFGLCPRINAAGRLYRADAGLELILTEDAARAAQVADELDHANHERRHTETRILFEAEAQVAQLGERAAYVLAGEGWHPGVIGIVASRIVERHNRPAVLIALEGDAGRGSGRSIDGFDLLGALGACAGDLRRHGGHRAAAGLEIERSRLEAFTAAFTDHTQRTLGTQDLIRVERVDAIVSGDELGLTLAEELARLAPFGAGNPAVSLLVPAATLREPRPMGEGRHVRFTVQAGGAQARAVAFGCAGRLPVAVDTPADASFTLEVNEWNGAVEPRLVLRHAQACAPEPVALVGEPREYLAAVWEELSAVLPGAEAPPAAEQRLVHDRRGRGVAGALAALVASRETVLVLCADASRRQEHLAGRVGGFSLCSHAALARDPRLAADVGHLALLDPPACAHTDGVARAGTPAQHVHLLWGEFELRFAQRIHERDHDLRCALAELYRVMRAAGTLEGADLETALKGGERAATDLALTRPAALAGRLVRVLSELQLVEIDPQRAAVSVGAAPRTSLECSATFRAHALRLAEGRRWLGSPASRAA